MIDNSFRKKTLIFKDPGNRHYYVALKLKTFFNLVVCSWFSAVRDCYILNTASRNEKSKKFSSIPALNFVSDSDKDATKFEGGGTKQVGRHCYQNDSDGNGLADDHFHNAP